MIERYDDIGVDIQFLSTSKLESRNVFKKSNVCIMVS